MYSMVTIANSIAYLAVAKKVNLKRFNHSEC